MNCVDLRRLPRRPDFPTVFQSHLRRYHRYCTQTTPNAPFLCSLPYPFSPLLNIFLHRDHRRTFGPFLPPLSRFFSPYLSLWFLGPIALELFRLTQKLTNRIIMHLVEGMIWFKIHTSARRFGDFVSIKIRSPTTRGIPLTSSGTHQFCRLRMSLLSLSLFCREASNLLHLNIYSTSAASTKSYLFLYAQLPRDVVSVTSKHTPSTRRWRRLPSADNGEGFSRGNNWWKDESQWTRELNIAFFRPRSFCSLNKS